MIPIKDKQGQYTCRECGQFFLDKSWAYCPICGVQIDWYFVGENNETKTNHA